MDEIIEDFKKTIQIAKNGKVTGNVSLRVNIKQGGVTNCNMYTEISRLPAKAVHEPDIVKH